MRKLSFFSGSMKRLLVVLMALVSCLAQFKSFSQAKAELDEDEILMGNLANLTIQVPVSSDTVKVRFPKLEEAKQKKLEYFTLLNDTVEIRVDDKQSLVRNGNEMFKRFDLSIQVFDSGAYKLPELDFIVGGKHIKSNPVSFSVIPVKATAQDKIDPFTDVAEPFDVMPKEDSESATDDAAGSLLWWLIPTAVILLAIIIFLYIRFKKTGSIFTFKPESPAVKAQHQLIKLQKQNLPERGRTKEYYTKLTDILRDYIGAEFGIKTFEKTTSEILNEVEANPRTTSYSELLKSILETSDFVKFAKVTPSSTENSRCMQDAERFVEITRPLNKEIEKGGEK